jgi:hypothetical protein
MRTSVVGSTVTHDRLSSAAILQKGCCDFSRSKSSSLYSDVRLADCRTSEIQKSCTARKYGFRIASPRAREIARCDAKSRVRAVQFTGHASPAVCVIIAYRSLAHVVSKGRSVVLDARASAGRGFTVGRSAFRTSFHGPTKSTDYYRENGDRRSFHPIIFTCRHDRNW